MRMKSVAAALGIGLGLLAATGPASAQPYGGYDRGYDGREYRRDRDYDRRDYDRGRGDWRDDRGGRRERGISFDEREYLRCNPDVRRAVMRGEMASGIAHFRRHGQYENRRLRC